MGAELPIPPGWYGSFARWHLLSLMRAPRMLRDITAVARNAAEPEKLHHLIRLVTDEVGYGLYSAVSAAKIALSRGEQTHLVFKHGDFLVDVPISRGEFEGWIAPELRQIAAAVDAALEDARLSAEQVDRVFLTGGSSLVPAVRHIFETRFGEARVVAGGEFVSVAEGLALMGQQRT